MPYPSEKEKEPPSLVAEDGELAPPSYEEAVPNAAPAALPEYDAPSYDNAAAGPSTSATLIAATSKFPPTLNGYFQWAFTRTFLLGPTAEERLFAASPRSGFRSKQREIILYDGPSDKHPVLATIGKSWTAMASVPAKVSILPRPDSGETRPYETEISGIPFKVDQSSASIFSVTVGGKATGTEPREEKFQWRNSRGSEVKELGKTFSYGWKLVRLSTPAAPAAGGSRSERDVGFTSDGHEVVAILATNMTSLTKGLKFSFMGRGLKGAFGERWEVVALLTGLWVWYTHVEGEH
ncbi:uncharacterized protein ColSpa_00575 [Colletotrichum spaethianum]|uniref:Uncharacterized protein n=1 Tax=Colletotrichum spaethianum TaxID=700344 RepID=A0AA37L5M2_9PEZI|nr:uncharacterized protein ColSpa_00575 [Colletotrichum spaethianum]GKT40394.1 hypothetical protein ColSpa_00575 [Colletotrichum spaethianum]